MLLTPLFVLVDDLGVLDHVVGIAAVGAVWARLTLLLGLLVEHLGELVGGRQESLLLALDLLDVAPGEGILGLLYGLLYLALSGTVDLAINVLQGPLDRVDEVVGVVADVSLLAAAPILLGVRLGVADHLIDLRVRKPARGGNRNPLLLARPEVLGPYVDDAVSVNVERNLDLRYTPGRRRYADELKVPDQLIVRSHLTFTLVHLYFDRTLIVVGRSKYLTLTCRYSCIPLDELCHHATLGFNTQREGRDVEEQHVLHFACEDPGLDGGAYGHDLIGVDALVRLLARDLLDLLLNGRDAGGAADEDNLVHLALAKPRVLHCLAHRTGRRLHKVRGELVELRTAKREIEVLGAVRIGGYKRQVDGCTRCGGELLFGLLRRLDEALGSHLVLREVYPLGLFELLHHPLDYLGVEVIATEVVVPARGLDLKDALTEREDRDVKRSTAEVEDEDGLLPFLVKPVGQSCGGRLVDDALDVEARDAACVFGRLPLGILEVGGHGDHRLGNLFAEIRLSVPLDLLQDHRGDLRWRVVLVVDAYPYITTGARDNLVTHTLGLVLNLPEAAAHKALGRVDRTLRVCHRLASSQLAYQSLPAPLIKGHHRWRSPLPLGAGNYDRVAALQDCNAAVGRAEVYPDAFAHLPLLSWGVCIPLSPFALRFLQSSVLGTLAQWLLC